MRLLIGCRQAGTADAKVCKAADAAGEQKNDVPTVRLTAAPPHADGLFVSRFRAAISIRIGMTPRRRGVSWIASFTCAKVVASADSTTAR
jgi:hypothetical protein